MRFAQHEAVVSTILLTVQAERIAYLLKVQLMQDIYLKCINK